MLFLIGNNVILLYSVQEYVLVLSIINFMIKNKVKLDNSILLLIKKLNIERK